ncbi:MAG: DUF3847 domain-containing protein [Clostridiales bacterium]|nr:DUF3847 domain-containing protein [Clostridiales bacterium]
MARKKTLDDVRADRERTEQKIKSEEQRLKILRAQEKELTRKERTHRLCNHGAMLEQYLDPEKYTTEQIEVILKTVFNLPDVIGMLSKKEQEPTA